QIPQKGSYVIQRKKKDGSTEIKIVHGNRLRIYKVPDVGWKLEELYKKTVLKDVEENNLTEIINPTEMFTQGRSQETATDINARLGPMNQETNGDDGDTIISMEDFEGLVTDDNTNAAMNVPDVGEWLNFLDLNTLGEEIVIDESDSNTRWDLTKEIKADAWEFETRSNQIAVDKKRNLVIIKRMAVNIIKLCHQQIIMPNCEAEYARYLHLRGFYISNITGKSRKAGRTMALKSMVRRMDPYENYAERNV
ncbi:hypothetical protein HPULCUR_012162, partial [Helicostylum pulchrum]